MNEESYRAELRNHFMGQMKNSKFQVNKGAVSKEKRSPTYDLSPTRGSGKSQSSQHYKELAIRSQQKPDYDSLSAYHRHHHHHHHQQHQLRQRRSSGGDADRVLFESNFALQHSRQHESYRRSVIDAANFNGRTGPSTMKDTLPALPSGDAVNKFHTEEPTSYIYETDSNIGGGSEESGKSQKTIVSNRSSQDLRKMVKSQCKLHEVIDETLKKMCNTEAEDANEEENKHISNHAMPISSPIEIPMPLPTAHCKRCTDKRQSLSRSSQKDVMTEIAKGDFLDCRYGDTLTISVDDVVNSKVINPMIRKLQRMYVNNLKEEMSLMEDLERLPYKVNEVYKATIFKQKE